MGFNVDVMILETSDSLQLECMRNLCQQSPPQSFSAQASDRHSGGVTDTVGVWPTQWGCGRHSGGVADTVGVWPTQWGCGRHSGGVADTVGLWPTQWGCDRHSGGVTDTVGV